eukprot:5162099-Pyramimonas_sp.AAC.2
MGTTLGVRVRGGIEWGGASSGRVSSIAAGVCGNWDVEVPGGRLRVALLDAYDMAWCWKRMIQGEFEHSPAHRLSSAGCGRTRRAGQIQGCTRWKRSPCGPLGSEGRSIQTAVAHYTGAKGPPMYLTANRRL